MWTPYLVAVASTGVAAALTRALWPADGSAIMALYYPAVIASAIYGNRFGATLAVVLSAASGFFFFPPPDQARLPTADHVYALVIFSLVSTLMVWLVERLKIDEKALRDGPEAFRRVLDVLPVGIYTCDGSGRLTYFNATAARLWGHAPDLQDRAAPSGDAARGLVCSDPLVASDEDLAARLLAPADSQGRREITIARPDAAPVTVLSHVHPADGLAGGPPGAIHVLVDITARKRDEDALRAQGALLDNAQRLGRMGSWFHDLRTDRLVWPEATCRLFGIAPAEFAGTFSQFHRLIVPDDLADYDAAHARASKSEPQFEAEYRIRRPDGAVRWIYTRGHLDTDAAGAPLARTGIVMDVTDQRVARGQLAESVAVLRIAGRAAHLGGWTIQLPGSELTWSEETCFIHDLPSGYKPTLEEGIGYYPAEYRAYVRQQVEACERDGTAYDFEVPKITATGRRIWVRSIGEAVRDADGRITRLQGAFQDITARREAEAALRDSEAELRTLTESMPQMVWMMRPDGRTSYLNQRWVDYTGLSLERSEGDVWQAPFHPDDRHRAEEAWQRALEGADYQVECRLRRADGRYRWMLVRGLPVRDAGGHTVKWIGTCTDIDDLKQAQEAALRSEGVQRALAADLAIERARLVAAQSVAGIGSWDTDLSSGAVTWSAEFQRILERHGHEGDLGRQGLLRHVHPDDRAAVDGAFATALDRHAPGGVEFRLMRADGRSTIIDGRWRIVHDDLGRPRVTGTCQDVTERRHAQDAMRLQAHMLDQIGQAVIATDAGGRVIYANRLAGELFGWASADMLGRTMADTVTHTSPSHGEIMAHVRRGDTWSGESSVQTRQGRVFPAAATVSPVLDERRDLVGVVGIWTDITARTLAEDQMRQKEALIRIAGRLTHTGGWAIELPSERVFWSDELFDILESPHKSEPSLTQALTLYPDLWREKVEAAIHACGARGTPFDLEVELLTVKGARKWVRISAEAERRADGVITRVQGALQDITERKQLEQQYLRAQRMESIGTLAGGIAHDLNNVLAPILMSIDLLQLDELDPDRLWTLATIETSAKRGAAMIARVLAFARGLDGTRREVQVAPLVRDVATIVRDTFPKNIKFEERVAPDLWPLQADPTQLHQVLLNLCVNARDAMPGGGRITITAERIEIDAAFAAVNIDARSGPYVTIGVHDTGSGIPPEIIDRIFDPFFTTKAIGKGTGLGLATSLAIVTGHQGFIRVTSAPGTGTWFQLYLPASTNPAALESAAPAAVLHRGNGEMVLVVDDEAGIRKMVQRTLETHGYRVRVAADGAAAVALYALHHTEIAAVFTDMMMPVMDGTATIKELVRMNPHVRIVVASGLATDANAAGAAGARVQRFLAKPYTAEDLLTAIRTTLAAPVDGSSAPGPRG